MRKRRADSLTLSPLNQLAGETSLADAGFAEDGNHLRLPLLRRRPRFTHATPFLLPPDQFAACPGRLPAPLRGLEQGLAKRPNLRGGLHAQLALQNRNTRVIGLQCPGPILVERMQAHGAQIG